QFTQFDALAVRRFVTAGGTAVLASDTGLPESALLDTFDVQVAGPIGPGRYPIGGVTFADPPTHAIAIDRGIAFSLGAGRVPLAAASGQAIVARPPRSSLEYIRGFAGLVRRSGHGEIARRRFQRELRRALARELGLDPETPIGDIVAEIATADRQRAARVRALDEALSRPLR